MSNEEIERLKKIQKDYEDGLIAAEEIDTQDLIRLIKLLSEEVKKLEEEN